MIALVSTPWPLFNRPSIQLGTLKAFISHNMPETRVEALHIYLEVAAALGYPLYKEISQSTWLAEPLYAALLYPEQAKAMEKFWHRKASKTRHCKGVPFKKVCETLEAVSQQALSSYDWGSYSLIGFSICFSQLTSSLYFIRKIKQMVPKVPIVIGGSSCSGPLGTSLAASFPEIDFVVSGEGELPLLALIKQIKEHPEWGELRFVPKIEQITNIDTLPPPDYDDYFRLLSSLGSEKAFLPKIPVEMSRGCWWNRCAFCNLNLQWRGYRAKSTKRVISELKTLSDKYQVLAFSFMDNLLPSKETLTLCNGLRKSKRDFQLFAEIRATTPPEILAAMGKAGIRDVQVGIEALSSSLLRKLNKGTTAMDNLEIMKHCETPGLPTLTGNLIMEFPSSDDNDVKETLSVLDFARAMRPLKAIPFWLGYGSPVWEQPRIYGIRGISNHPNYKAIFPPSLFRSLNMMIQGYHGPIRRQRRLWQSVRQKVAEWQKEYQTLHASPRPEPILSYLDGGEFLIIRQRRAHADLMTHKLKGTSRKIYLFCQTQRTIQEITARFPSFASDKIEAFLRMMVGKRLMFQEGEKFLSLAVPMALFL